MMRFLAYLLLLGTAAGLAIVPVEEDTDDKGRTSLDEEELVHAVEARNEALEEEASERRTLDEEELLHAIEARNEAIEMEIEDEQHLLQKIQEEEELESRHIVEPAPLPLEERHIAAGLGVQFLGLGAGASAGIGNGGVGFNANAGLGNDFTKFGTPAHYSQYYAQPAYPVDPVYPVYGPWVPVESRSVGLGGGVNLGPLGVGASAGIGHGQIGISGGFGFGGKYANYGRPAHYQQYYNLPYRGPYFHPGQLI